MDAAQQRSAVMVLRAWLHEGTVVVRLQSVASDRDEHEAVLGVGVDPVVELVRDWLRAFAATQR